MTLFAEDLEVDRGGTSTSLIAGLRARDEAAWVRLVSLYSPVVYCWCRESQVPADDARDLVQQVFAKVLSSLDSFRHDRDGDTFRGWLWKITRNTILDHFRTAHRQAMGQGGTEAYQRLQQLADPDATSSSMSVQGRIDLARRAFDLVRPEFAAPAVRAFEMIVFEDCTASDAARRVGMTADAVRQAKCRILRRLREVLGDSE